MDLLGTYTGRKVMFITFVKHLTAATTYFIHCDLLDREEIRFAIKGLPYAKVSYEIGPQQVLRDCSTDAFINTITLSVKD